MTERNTPQEVHITVPMEIEAEELDSNTSDQYKWSYHFVSKSLLTFIFQAIFSLCVVIFCIIKLSNNNLNQNDKTIYLTMLSTNIAVWYPSPTLSLRKK